MAEGMALATLASYGDENNRARRKLQGRADASTTYLLAAY